MDIRTRSELISSRDTRPSDIPITRLVVEVYESASPSVKSLMLAQLMSQILESASRVSAASNLIGASDAVTVLQSLGL